MLIKLALRNIIGYGWRSLINMMIIAIILIGMVWMEAMYYSWISLGKTQSRQWEYLVGLFQVEGYDPFDAFTWEDSHAPVPPQLETAVASGGAIPVLLSPGVIYPRQKMISALVRGIPAGQRLLKFPTQALRDSVDGYPTALIGKAMAKSSRLEEGDVFTLRVKDSSGAFNTVDLRLDSVLDIPVPNLDIATVWVDLEVLRGLKQLPEAATNIAFEDPALANVAIPGFRFIGEKEYFRSYDEIMKTENFSKYMIYALLMFLAMIAIFDTQALALFKRRKEIGTLAALGMTKGQIIRLFTLEGGLNSLFGCLLGAVLGFPLFYYFAVHGYKLPEGYDDFGIAGFSEPILYKYPPEIVLGVFFWIMLITVAVSWLAARRISRLKPTEALKGKAG